MVKNHPEGPTKKKTKRGKGNNGTLIANRGDSHLCGGDSRGLYAASGNLSGIPGGGKTHLESEKSS